MWICLRLFTLFLFLPFLRPASGHSKSSSVAYIPISSRIQTLPLTFQGGDGQASTPHRRGLSATAPLTNSGVGVGGSPQLAPRPLHRSASRPGTAQDRPTTGSDSRVSSPNARPGSPSRGISAADDTLFSPVMQQEPPAGALLFGIPVTSAATNTVALSPSFRASDTVGVFGSRARSGRSLSQTDAAAAALYASLSRPGSGAAPQASASGPSGANEDDLASPSYHPARSSRPGSPGRFEAVNLSHHPTGRTRNGRPSSSREPPEREYDGISITRKRPGMEGVLVVYRYGAMFSAGPRAPHPYFSIPG